MGTWPGKRYDPAVVRISTHASDPPRHFMVTVLGFRRVDGSAEG